MRSCVGTAPASTCRPNFPPSPTAMGHVSIVSTAYYLAFLEPVAEAASERFARHCRPLLDALPGGGGAR